MSAIKTTGQRVKSLEERIQFWVNGICELEDRTKKIEAFIGAHNLTSEEEEPMYIEQEEYDRLMERVGALKRECDGLKKLLLEQHGQHEEEVKMKICNKYGVNGRGRVYNLQSGREVPEDEPLYLFRGKDRHLPDVLQKYADRCENEEHARTVMATRNEVMRWQGDNWDSVKEPDTGVQGNEQFSTDGVALANIGGFGADVSTFGQSSDEMATQRAIGELKCEDPQTHVEVVCRRLTNNHRDITDVSVDNFGYLIVTHQSGATTLYNANDWETCLRWREARK